MDFFLFIISIRIYFQESLLFINEWRFWNDLCEICTFGHHLYQVRPLFALCHDKVLSRSGSSRMDGGTFCVVLKILNILRHSTANWGERVHGWRYSKLNLKQME